MFDLKRSPTPLTTALLLMVLAIACKKDPPSKPSPPTRDLASAKSELEGKRATIVGKLPPELKETLKFEVKTQKGEHTIGIVPSGWTAGFMPNELVPSDRDTGSTTSFRIGHNCDGMCEPKDWAKIIQHVEVDGTKTGGTVTTDASRDGERVLVVRGEWAGGKRVLIVVARWNALAKRYFSCRVDLVGSYAEASDAFEAACRAFVVLDWDS